MTTAAEPTDRAVVAARIIGELESMMRAGLLHPSRQVRIARLVNDYNRALDGAPSPEAAARQEGRTS
jgi:hypothetical protein